MSGFVGDLSSVVVCSGTDFSAFAGFRPGFFLCGMTSLSLAAVLEVGNWKFLVAPSIGPGVGVLDAELRKYN